MPLRAKKEKTENKALEDEVVEEIIPEEELNEDAQVNGKSVGTKKETANTKPAPRRTGADRVILAASADEIETRNEVKIAGRVTNVFKVPNQQTVVLSVATNAGGGASADGGLISNFPRVTFYGRRGEIAYKALVADRAGPRGIREAKSTKIPKSPQVVITGTIQTTKQLRDGEFIYRQTIVGETLTLAPTRLEMVLNTESGLKEIGDENEVILIGEIVHIFRFTRKTPGTILTIKTSNRRTDFPKATLYWDLHDLSRDMEVGDHVVLVGMMQTRRDEVDGKTIFRENIVATDLDWYRD